MPIASITTDEQHRATLAVLQEAVDYLRRLPPVPVTIEMCSKLQRHLDNPTNRLLARQQDTWTQEAVTAAGVMYLMARLRGNVLDLKIPAPTRDIAPAQVDQLAIGSLRAGLRLPLQNRGFDPFAAAGDMRDAP